MHTRSGGGKKEKNVIGGNRNTPFALVLAIKITPLQTLRCLNNALIIRT